MSSAATSLFSRKRSRGLATQVIQRFRGINVYSTVTSLGPEWAQDLNNVVVSGSGGLSKMRLPVPLSAAIAGINTGPDSFWDFQQGNGTRQVLAFFGSKLYYYTLDLTVANFIEDNVLNAGQWSIAAANNILFGANGQRMQKWTGLNWQKWGIDAPTVAPSLAFTTPFVNATRAANVVTVQVNNGPTFGLLPAVGDIITMSAMVDPTFNGTFQVATVDYTNRRFTYPQVAANAVSAPGSLTMKSDTFNQTITAITRAGGVVTATVASTTGIGQGAEIAVSGVGDPSFNANFTVTANTATTVSWLQAGPDASSAAGIIGFRLKPQTGYTWVYAYGNSATGHVSNVSPVSEVSQTGADGRRFHLSATASTDPQVDQYYWFRILDGGGDYFLAGITIVPSFTDGVLDSALDQTIRGPLINNPPLQGSFVAVGQNRVFVFRMVGALQEISYSGFEQIFLGRPEESFPPNNRLRLSIGAEQVAGGGVLQSGVIAFSQTGRMYALRGAIEDITLAAPVNFSSFLEELPWTLGCLSHFTIQATPYGLIWLAGDKTVQMFDGHSEPVDVSVPVYPLLRQITPGTENLCVSGYFNWLERDWYVLLAAVNGSLAINRMFMFAANKQASGDGLDSIEVFISDIPATLPIGTPWIGVITTSTLQRRLCISAQGKIQKLPVSPATIGGITTDFTIDPPTAGKLSAFWRPGYFGNESPTRSKLFRWLRLVSDQDPTVFQITTRYVDDETRTVRNPEIQGPVRMGTVRLGLNRRAKRAAPEINFPSDDMAVNVLEMQVASIPTSER